MVVDADRDVTAAVAQEVRRLARELLPHSDEVAVQVTEYVVQRVPELAWTGEPEWMHVAQASTEQNIGVMLAMLAFDITPKSVEPPDGTRQLLAALTAGGGDLSALLRAYRLAHEQLWCLWTDHVRSRARSDTDVAGVLQASSRLLFDIVDRLSERLVEERDAHRDDADHGTTGRTELVRRLLGPEPVDVRAVASALGYDLSRHHVALLATPTDERADVRRELDRVVDAARVPTLVTPSGHGEWWAWLGWPEPPPASTLEGLAAVAVHGVVIGLGEPDRGRDGFRRSHERAAEAERTRRLAVRLRAGVVRQRDVEITALLCSDPDRARRTALERLGPLAARDEAGARMRETLRAFLAHGHHRALAATTLNVHHKTVAYRLQQAETLLGRSLAGDTFDLEAALAIDAALHGDCWSQGAGPARLV